MRYKKSYGLALALLFLACKKDDGPGHTTAVGNSIAAVVNNNFSVALFNFGLIDSHYSDTLSGAGPFTLFAASNNALTVAGFSIGAAVINAKDSMRTMMPYLILEQRLRMDSLPFSFDQPFMTSNGQDLYITHWANARDTAIIVNGGRVSVNDKPASNGLINVTDQLLYPPVFHTVQEAVSGNSSLTIFNAMLQQSGLKDSLQGAGPFTVFAPTNAAFSAIGITGTDSVYHMDPAVLKDWVRAHLTAGRNFVYDYILKADITTNTYPITMANGEVYTLSLINDISNPGRFNGFYLNSSMAMASLSTRDVLAGNGVLHSISSVLKH